MSRQRRAEEDGDAQSTRTWHTSDAEQGYESTDTFHTSDDEPVPPTPPSPPSEYDDWDPIVPETPSWLRNNRNSLFDARRRQERLGHSNDPRRVPESPVYGVSRTRSASLPRQRRPRRSLPPMDEDEQKQLSPLRLESPMMPLDPPSRVRHASISGHNAPSLLDYGRRTRELSSLSPRGPTDRPLVEWATEADDDDYLPPPPPLQRESTSSYDLARRPPRNTPRMRLANSASSTEPTKGLFGSLFGKKKQQGFQQKAPPFLEYKPVTNPWAKEVHGPVPQGQVFRERVNNGPWVYVNGNQPTQYTPIGANGYSATWSSSQSISH